MVLALVEEQAGLLPVAQVDPQADVALAHLDRAPAPRRGGRETTGSRPSRRPHLRVVALHDALRLEELHERGDDLGLGPLGGLRERLDGEVVAVAVDDERGEPVALAVDDAVRLCPGGHRRAPDERALDPRRARSRRAAPRPARSCAGGSRTGSTRGRSRAARRATRPRARPRPGSRRRPRVTSERKTHGCPRSMRACALAADDDRPLDVHQGLSIHAGADRRGLRRERPRVTRPRRIQRWRYGDGAMGDGADGGAGPPSAGP